MPITILTKTDFWNLFDEARSLAGAAAAFIRLDSGTREAIKYQIESRLNALEREFQRIYDLSLLSGCPLRAGVDRREWGYDMAKALDDLARQPREAWVHVTTLSPDDFLDPSATDRANQTTNAKADLVNQAGNHMFPLLDLIDPENGRVAAAIATTKDELQPPGDVKRPAELIGDSKIKINGPDHFLGSAIHPEGSAVVDLKALREIAYEAGKRSQLRGSQSKRERGERRRSMIADQIGAGNDEPQAMFDYIKQEDEALLYKSQKRGAKGGFISVESMMTNFTRNRRRG